MIQIEKISELITHLQETNMRPKTGNNHVGINSQLLNEIATALGCDGNFSTDQIYPSEGGGSLIDAALMYQILLLAKSVSEIKDLFKHVETLVFPSDGERRLFVEKYIEAK